MYPPMSSLQFKEKLERILEPILLHQYHQNRAHVASISCFIKFCDFKAGTVKRATNWKRKTYSVTLLQNELESDVTLFTTHEKNFARQVRNWVVKRATSVIKSICRNVANQVPHFFLALYRDRKSHRVAHFLLLRVLIFAILVVSFTNHNVGSHVFLCPISVTILNAICRNRTNWFKVRQLERSNRKNW